MEVMPMIPIRSGTIFYTSLCQCQEVGQQVAICLIHEYKFGGLIEWNDLCVLLYHHTNKYVASLYYLA